MAQILILVGTESGNAQMVGEAAAEELERQGHTVQLANSGDCDTLELARREVILVCTSTHGDGEYPDNIIPLADSLEAKRPDLSTVRYGVIALGDTTHEQFCNAGRMFDALLAGLGAKRVGERLELDACETPLPDLDAAEWAKEWGGLI